MLQTEPSFSIYDSEDGFEEESEKKDLERERLVKSDGDLERSVTIGDNIESMASGEFSFGKKIMGFIEENEEKEEDTLNGFKNLGIEAVVKPGSPPMYLATGFGVDGNGVGSSGVELNQSSFDEGGDVEEYYKRMASQDPNNSLFLRNYAQLLKSKGDLPGAEEYYFRATLADPKDGEIMLQYAKLVWELHHDQDRALSYFECAARAAPEDSNVLAAYASFLWEIDEDENEDCAHDEHPQTEGEGQFQLQNSVLEEQKKPVSLGIDVTDFGSGMHTVDYTAAGSELGANGEEYYKRMVEENPYNPLFLRNYAQYLRQSKGDLQAAEQYYSRAIVANPGGEIISEYAKLVWELHHDQDKALCYFERAVEAAPMDSHVLAAYARFLWETEDGEEHSEHRDDIQMPVFQGGAMTPAYV